MENKAYLLQLFQKYRDNRCSPDEVKQLLAYFRKDSEQQEQLMALVLDQLQQQPTAGELDNDKLDTIMDDAYQNIQQQLHYPDTAKQNTAWLMWKKVAAAAIVFIALGLGTYFYFANHTGTNNQQQTTNNDIPPGGNRAILTLADGRKIVLDEAANGELAEESGMKITKTADGQIVYEILRHAPQARASEERQPEAGVAGWRASVTRDPATYNTIQTPRGGQYKVILPDSSVVWLNAASSLKYPTHFAGAERRVELSGEAYFKVRQLVRPLADETQDIRHKTSDTRHKTASAQADEDGNKSKIENRTSKIPFIVASRQGTVKVLGTEFNISAYEEEGDTQIALVSGAVEVGNTANGKSARLRPGQMAVLKEAISVKTIDMEEATAWKEGMFIFHDTPFGHITRQLQRWYDIEFSVPPDVEGMAFYTEINRNTNLSEVLYSLEQAGNLKFTIEGRRVIVAER